ncbi:MAG: hypothetical protein AAB728_00685 [Patescibacteria group bacterium]
MNRPKLAFSLSLGSALAVVAVTAITVAADLRPPFKTFLASLTGHHWISKGLVALVLCALVFLALLPIPFRPSPAAVRRSLWILVWASLLGTAVLTAFFVWEAMR